VRILASTPRRVIARLIDLVVTPLTMCTPYLLLLMVFINVANTDSGLTGIATGMAVAGGFISAIGGLFLARVVRIARYGCTVGQRIAGGRSVRKHGDTRTVRSRRTPGAPRERSSTRFVRTASVERQKLKAGKCRQDHNLAC
jgi:uncharacterized RDD family membrane protein YckC